jgi:hypothetical protein
VLRTEAGLRFSDNLFAIAREDTGSPDSMYSSTIEWRIARDLPAGAEGLLILLIAYSTATIHHTESSEL